MKITLDTNIIRVLVDPQHTLKINEVLLDIIDKNDCNISYGTLFELLTQFQNSEDMVNRILLFLTKKNIIIATNSEVDTEQFYRLVYSGCELSLLGLQTVAKSLFDQTSRYVGDQLSELFDLFSVSYAYMKFNKQSDAYESYMRYSAMNSNDFWDFKLTIQPYFTENFNLSYMGIIKEKFDTLVKNTFWRIVLIIESRYSVLENHPSEYILELDWKPVFDEARLKFEREHTIKDYQKIIRSSFRALKRGQKKMQNIDEVLSYIDYSEVSALERDFLQYYLKRLLTGEAQIAYNDMIDFMNLSIASKQADCLLTLDYKFLKGPASHFQSINTSDFYKQSLCYSQQIRKE